MRQIVLDTETTGLDPQQVHRIIQLAGIEVVNRTRDRPHDSISMSIPSVTSIPAPPKCTARPGTT